MTSLATMSDTLTTSGTELIILLMLVYIVIDNRWTKKSIQAMKEDIAKLEEKMNEGFREVRVEIKDIRTEVKEVRKDIEGLNAKTDKLTGVVDTVMYFNKPHIKPNTGSAQEQKADAA